MKTGSLILFFLIFSWFSGSLQAQSKWKLINPQLFEGYISCLDDLGKKVCFISHSSGNNKFYFSNDSGNTWYNIEMGTGYFNDIKFIGTKIFAVNNNDYPQKVIISRSSDEGLTWESVFISEEYAIGRIYNIAEQSLSAIGLSEIDNKKALFISTSDDGESWDSSSTHFNSDIFGYSSIMLDQSNAFIVTRETRSSLLRTSDRGATWDTLLVSDGGFSAYKFINADTGFAITKSSEDSVKFMITTNRGITWDIQNFYYDFYIATVEMENSIIYVSLYGLYLHEIIKSADMGRTWKTILTIKSGEYVNGISFNKDNTGYVWGSALQKSLDVGETWVNKNNRGPWTYDVSFSDAKNGIFINGYDSSRISKTSDGGKSWTEFIPNIKPLQTPAMLTPDIILANSTDYNASPFSRNFVRSIDGGITWQSVFNDGLYYSIHRIDEVNCFIVSQETDRKRLLLTNDASSSWRQIFSSENDIFLTAFSSGRDGFIVSGSYILKTGNGGVSWTPCMGNIGSLNFNEIELKGIASVDENTCFIYGTYKNNGILLKTFNAGNSWETHSIPFTNSLFTNIHMDFASRDEYYLRDGLRLYNTIDGAMSWTEFKPFGQIYRMEFYNGIGWAQNTETDIYYYSKDNLFLNDYPNNLNFELPHNFPNPFNPNTTIRVELPVYGHVKLTVHDILGREVAVLLDENKLSGSYDILFDADKYNLSSGVYIYTLQIGNNLKSGKMLFLK